MSVYYLFGYMFFYLSKGMLSVDIEVELFGVFFCGILVYFDDVLGVSSDISIFLTSGCKGYTVLYYLFKDFPVSF